MIFKKNTLLAALVVAVVLIAAFQLGGRPQPSPSPSHVPSPVQTVGTATPLPTQSVPTPSVAPTPTAEPPAPTPDVPAPTPDVPAPTPDVPAPTAKATPTPATQTLASLQGLDGAEAVPEGRPEPLDPEAVTLSDTAYTCTLSVSCATLLDNLDQLGEDKAALVPEDGIIFPATTVTFYEGESVFNLLQRELKKAKIHLEFVNTPFYHSAYIEGIHNLYEFDCGELSGWTYKVNNWFPIYGCSRYALQDGDVVEWVYTCDLGADVGAGV